MRLTPGAEAAWMIAAGEAAAGGHPRIEPAHLLIGVLSLGKLGPGAEAAGFAVSAALVRGEHERLLQALSGCGVDPTRLRRRSRAQLGRGPVQGPPTGPLSRSTTCKAVFAAAEDLAGAERAVGVAHLLAALAEDVDAVTARIVRQAGADLARLREALVAAGAAPAGEPAPPDATPPGLAPAPSDTPHLDRFGRDLTALARRGELGPIVGRRREIQAVLHALARTARTHPVLVGEPGVGKAAIVEAIAIRSAEDREPSLLAGLRVVELSVGALLQGGEHPGTVEERVQGVVAEARSHPGVVLFVEPMHSLPLLMPVLARGELRAIGAATPAQYRRLVEADPALERRLERVIVDETDRDETLEILRGLRPAIERRHGVALPDEALAAAVDLSSRFETERRLPEKAVDLVDMAAARTRLPHLSLVHLPAGRGPVSAEAPPVTPVIVARVLAERRRLPLDLVAEALDSGLGSRLLALEGFLRERVLGQDEAIARVSRRLRLAFASSGGRRGPIAVLLFLGPGGVGKTETARLLAEHLFGSASGMIRIDGSQLSGEAGLAGLVGAPGQEGQLTSSIRAKPHALLLLDEVERAHPKVLELFVQLFDAGTVPDADGRPADGRHLVVVMTSNPGTTRPAPGKPDDSGPTVPDLHGVFPLDLLNRVDEIVVFRPLDPDDVEMIVGRALDELTSAVERRHGVRVRVTPEAARFAAQQAALAAPGARGAKRTVERLVHGPLGALVLTGKLTRHTSWVAVYDEGGIYLLPEG